MQEVLKNNPQAQVVTNASVGKKLTEMGVAHFVVEGRNNKSFNNVVFEAFDGKHEEIFEEIGQV